MSEEARISELVKVSIEAKILQAFKDTPDLIDDLVRACLMSEVNEHGGEPGYPSREKMPYLTYLARDTIRTVAREAVEKHIGELTPRIEQQVREGLQAADVVDAFTKAILQPVQLGWGLHVHFEKTDS